MIVSQNYSLSTTFYVEKASKIFLFTFLTGGLYVFLWSFFHWRHFKRRSLAEIKTFNEKDRKIRIWIPLLVHLYIIGLGRRIKLALKEKKIKLNRWIDFNPWLNLIVFVVASPNSYFPVRLHSRIIQFLGKPEFSDFSLFVQFVFIYILVASLIAKIPMQMQIGANKYMLISQEIVNVKSKFTKIDICIMIYGILATFLGFFGAYYYHADYLKNFLK